MMHTCRICGEADEDVQLLVGGILSFAHEKCTKNVDVIIDIFLESIVTMQNGTVYLAEELIKAQKRVYQSSTPTMRNNDEI